MRLRRFSAKGVHGYLNFNIRFNDDLSFLTGINGSGKTTALNAIVALITPDLSTLSSLVYDNLTVEFENDGSRFTVTAMAEGSAVSIKASDSEAPFTFNKFSPDPDSPPPRQNELEAEHFRDLIANSSTHPVLKLIAALPTPMFLGLDRRARFDVEDRRARYWNAGTRSSRMARNVFSASLARSLNDAADLAETRYRDVLISTGRIGERLQRDMLLNLLTTAAEDFGTIAVPTQAELKDLEKVRKDLEALPRIFHLPKDEVQSRVAPFVEHLQKIARSIPSNTQIEELFKGETSDSPVMKALFSWSANRSQLKRIRLISDTVSSYNAERLKKLEPTERYLRLVNGFLNDSGKSIEFNERGYLAVAIKGIEDRKPIASLSSGEAQIFVILTHLAFNPLAQGANVFIIDEPELSLHVRWQELFVESVRSANPNIQYILATHSPSIILDKMKKCVDLNMKSVRNNG